MVVITNVLDDIVMVLSFDFWLFIRYVSLEMAYLCQSFFLQQDLALYDADRDSPAECHSSGMCADLGQVDTFSFFPFELLCGLTRLG